MQNGVTGAVSSHSDISSTSFLLYVRLTYPLRPTLTRPGDVFVLSCLSRQRFRSLCSWIWDIRNQVHIRRIHHQGVLGRRDFLYQGSNFGELCHPQGWIIAEK